MYQLVYCLHAENKNFENNPFIHFSQKDDAGEEEEVEEEDDEEGKGTEGDEGEGEGEQHRDDEETAGGARAVAVPSKKRKLINQFNYCERAALTTTNPKRVSPWKISIRQ